MSFDPNYCLSTILPLAKAAYTVTVPPGWEIVARIETNEKPAVDFGAIMRQPSGLTVPGGLSISGTRIAACIRGTERLEEWFGDFDARPVESLYGGAGRIAHGFQDWYSRIRTSLFNGLGMAGAYDELDIIGHSLGGALAQEFARELAMYFKQQKLGFVAGGPKILAEPTLWTFESPRPYQADAIQQFNQLVTEFWRIESWTDIVPHVPPTNLGYVSGGSLVALRDGVPFTLDVHMNHSLDTCALGLQKMVQDLVLV